MHGALLWTRHPERFRAGPGKVAHHMASRVHGQHPPQTRTSNRPILEDMQHRAVHATSNRATCLIAPLCEGNVPASLCTRPSIHPAVQAAVLGQPVCHANTIQAVPHECAAPSAPRSCSWPGWTGAACWAAGCRSLVGAGPGKYHRLARLCRRAGRAICAGASQATLLTPCRTSARLGVFGGRCFLEFSEVNAWLQTIAITCGAGWQKSR